MPLGDWIRNKFSREQTAREGKAEQEAAIADYGTDISSLLGDYATQAGTNLSDYLARATGNISDYQSTAGQSLNDYLSRATGNISGFQSAAQKNLADYLSGATQNIGDYRGTALADISSGLAGQTGIIDKSISELDKLFKEDYYSDYLSRPEVANAIRQKQEQFRENLNQFKGSAIRGGGTIESQLAASGSLGKDYSNFLANLVSEGEARKQGLKSDYLSRKTGLNLEKSGLIGSATGQRLGVGGNVLGSQSNVLSNMLQGGQNIAGTALSAGQNLAGNVLQGGQNIAGTALSAGQNLAGNVLQGGQNIAGTQLGVGSGAIGNTLQSLLGTSKGFTDTMLNIKNDRLAALSQGINQILSSRQGLSGGEGGNNTGALSMLLSNPEILAAIGSDVKFKKNIKYLITINGIKFYSFKYKDTDKFPKGEQIGVIAQEVGHIPDAVIQKEDGKYVNYNVIKSYINERV